MGKIIPAAKCSQMSNPKTGTGSGGDRCCEATLAMIDCTYKIGAMAKAGDTSQAIMYDFTERWNEGRTTSALEPTSRISDYLSESDSGIGFSKVSGTFANVQVIVDRGHVAATAVRDYRQLRLLGGGNPYEWNPEREPACGHILLIVGYGDGVVVHDPLRSDLTGQPAEYSVTSFEAAGWEEVDEIIGPRLDNPAPPEAFTHKIQPGETFWSIAERFYGDGTLDKLLIEANPQCDPRALKIGSTITIPPKPEVAA